MPLLRGLSIVAVTALLYGMGSDDAGAAGKRALLVGIGDYENIPDLKGPPVDIANVERFLIEDWGFAKDEIAVLQDSTASRKNIIRAMEQWLINSTKPGDDIVFYYSGHGGQVKDRNGDERDGLDETLSPHDTSKNFGNQITDDTFSKLLGRMKGRNLTAIIDSCHSGTISRGGAPAANTGDFSPRTYFPRFRGGDDAKTQKRKEQAHRREESFVRNSATQRIWSAASSNQYAWGNRKGGIFTNYFLEGLRDRKADSNVNGVVSNAELLSFVRTKTKAWCDSRKQCNRGFTPSFEAPKTEFVAGAAIGTGVHVVAVEPTDVLVGHDNGEVDIQLLPGNRVKLGQKIRFRVTSKHQGWLVLLDVNAEGQVTQLFPNDIMRKNGKSNAISPGNPITVPDAYYGFDFRASEPTGEGTMIALVTQDNIDIAQLLEENGSLASMSDPKIYLAELAAALTRVWTNDRVNRSARWSRALKGYTIVR